MRILPRPIATSKLPFEVSNAIDAVKDFNKAFKIKFLILLDKPSLACFISSSSGELLCALAIEGNIGFDFFGL